MVDQKKAVSYVRRHGDEVQIARLASILWHEPPTESALRGLRAIQAADGGYGRRCPGVSSIEDTGCVLGWIDDLGLRRGPLVDPACWFLIDRQQEDGGWTESSEWGSNDPEARVWLTGLCAHVLIRLGYAEAPGTRCPTDFLLAHSDGKGQIGGACRTTGQALPMLAFHPGTQSAPHRDAVNAIQREYRTDWSGGAVASLLSCLRDGGLGPGHPLVLQALEDLERAQRADGSWEPDSHDDDGVRATIAALRALRVYGRL